MSEKVQKRTRKVVKAPAAFKQAESLLDIRRVWTVELKQAYQAQKKFHNRHTLGMWYVPKNMVWLSSKNLKTTTRCKKLDYKRNGLFRVLKDVGRQAYRLELPDIMKIHPMFHMALLEPYGGSNDNARPPPPILEGGKEKQELE